MPVPPIRFEEFELDTESCELRRSGRPIKLERIPMELLVLLLQNPGKLLRRETIEQKLWAATASSKLSTALTQRSTSSERHFETTQGTPTLSGP